MMTLEMLVARLTKLEADYEELRSDLDDTTSQREEQFDVHGDDANGFSGVAYVSGTKYEDLNTYPTRPWVVIPLDGGTPREENGPAPATFPDNEEWFEKAKVFGDIHVLGTR